ncbi:Flp family type IVb pilin [Nocardioides panacisoli]
MDLDDSDGSYAVGSSAERGATAVEYALLIALIAGVIVATVAVLGPQVVSFYQSATQGW